MEYVDRDLIEDNVKLARQFIEDVFGGGNPNSFDDLVADDIVVSSVLKPEGLIVGKAEFSAVLGRTVSGGQFSDFELEIEDIAALVDGRVLVRLRGAATHVGEVFGIAPTHRRITMHGLHLLRFREGRLVELTSGGLNPLEFEMLFAPAISKLVFGDKP